MESHTHDSVVEHYNDAVPDACINCSQLVLVEHSDIIMSFTVNMEQNFSYFFNCSQITMSPDVIFTTFCLIQ